MLIRSLAMMLALTTFALASVAHGQEASAPTKNSILYIGDSHSDGFFGKFLDKKLRALPGSDLTSHASCGSIADWWFTGKETKCGYHYQLPGETERTWFQTHETPLFKTLLAQVRPDIIVIALGTNYIINESAILSDIEQIANAVMEAQTLLSIPTPTRCYWIGPPDSKKYGKKVQHTRDLIKEALEVHPELNCKFFDSSDPKVTRFTGTDRTGIHYHGEAGKKMSEKWASRTYEWIQSSLNAWSDP